MTPETPFEVASRTSADIAFASPHTHTFESAMSALAYAAGQMERSPPVTFDDYERMEAQMARLRAVSADFLKRKMEE